MARVNLTLSAISKSLTYCRQVIFIETPIFTHDVKAMLADGDYWTCHPMTRKCSRR
ncbi:MAG: hypothetical protein RL603_92 [Pseudomonadota bacterium]